MDTDQQLLFAVLAHQADFLSRERFLDACRAWSARKDVAMADLLVARGWLKADERAAIERLAALKAQRHGSSQAALSQASSYSTDGESIRLSLAGTVDLAPPPGKPSRSGSDAVRPGQIKAGDTVYLCTRLHAAGGIGQVWLAQDGAFGREVALKELKPDRAGRRELWARFLREARITGQLQHPSIVPVYAIGIKPGSGEPFYTMRFVRGRTLGEAVRDYHHRRQEGSATMLDLRDLLSAFVSVCQAVAYAHSRGVLHRDLKPQNVVLGDFGEVMVLDWGLAKLISEPPDHPDAAASTVDAPVSDEGTAAATVAGHVLGTPAYMAPEQARGEIGLLGARTDVYGLGAILYEILTGQPPFRGPRSDVVLRQVCDVPPLPPRSIVASTPRPLEAICTRALAKRQEDRYAAARDLADEVRRYLADEAVAAHREGILPRLSRWARRHRPVVAAALTGFILLLLFSTVLIVRAAQQRESRRREADRLRAEVDHRRDLALEVNAKGDLDQAIARLAEAAGVCHTSPELAEREKELGIEAAHLERFRDLRARATVALRNGMHNVRSRERPDPVLRDCEAALAVYQAETRPDWRTMLDAAVLSPAQKAEAARLTHQVLVLAAMRLAMFDPGGEAGEASTRRGLLLLERASDLETPTTGIWLLRMLWHRRLKENEAADRAGKEMERSAAAGGMRQAWDFYVLGSVYLHMLKNPDYALHAYQQALVREPNHYAAHFGIFLVFHERKALPEQVAALTACLALWDQADLFTFRGAAQFELKHYDRALDDFDAALARDPKSGLAHYWRGRSNVMFKRLAEAERDLDRAVGLGPENTHWLSWRGVARARLGRHREAAKDADEAVRREPKEATTLFFAARAYAQCVRAALADAAADRAKLAKAYSDRAIDLLQQAVTRGFADAERLQENDDFNPVRDRAEFQRILAGLEKKSP